MASNFLPFIIGSSRQNVFTFPACCFHLIKLGLSTYSHIVLYRSETQLGYKCVYNFSKDAYSFFFSFKESDNRTSLWNIT